MSTPLVHLHVEDRIATLTITRPKALNALNTAVINALHSAGHTHVTHIDMPVSPARVWAAINAQ